MSRESTTGETPADKTLDRNVEIKARVDDLAGARETAERIATESLGVLHQIDTYFECNEGRLKLREIDEAPAQLIWYQRPDVTEPKRSDYCLLDVSDPAALRRGLETVLGVRLVVDKRREVFLYHNVRIHLDDVVDLGQFIEFEAVLSPDESDAKGQEQVDFLCGEFNISVSDLLSTSYVDLAESLQTR